MTTPDILTQPEKKRFALVTPQTVRYALLALFLVQFGICFARLRWPQAPDRALWPEVLLLFLALGAIVAGLTREVPLQNVLLAGAIIGATSCLGAVFLAAAVVPSTHAPSLAGQGNHSWLVPLLWIVALLSSRSLARRILLPYRGAESYGYWVIGLTVVLALIFHASSAFFPVNPQHLAQGSLNPSTGLHMAARIGTALLISVLITPILLSKRPVPATPDPFSAAVWVLASLLFATAAGLHHSWWPASWVYLVVLTASALSLRAAKVGKTAPPGAN